MIFTNDMIKQKNAKKRKIKKITNTIYILLIIMFFLIMGYICYFKFIKKQNSVKFLGISQYVVMTGSMVPNYNIGDIIIDKEIKKDEIKEGDVITYSVGDGRSTVSHRIIEIIEKDGETYYKTKGDNNESPDDDLVKFSQIQGKAIYKIDKIGIIIKEATTGTGVVIIILILILIYLKNSKQDEKISIRETARKKYNIPKY